MVMNGCTQRESEATGISDSKIKRKPFPGVFRECAGGLRGADTVDRERVNYYAVTFKIKKRIEYKNLYSLNKDT